MIRVNTLNVTALLTIWINDNFFSQRYISWPKVTFRKNTIELVRMPKTMFFCISLSRYISSNVTRESFLSRNVDSQKWTQINGQILIHWTVLGKRSKKRRLKKWFLRLRDFQISQIIKYSFHPKIVHKIKILSAYS